MLIAAVLSQAQATPKAKDVPVPAAQPAEPKAERARERDTAATTQPATTPTKKKKVIRLDAIAVEGRIQKPQAFYILQRSNLSFEGLNRAESFSPKVVETVESDPF
jgi:hypothetical protein